MENQIVKLVEDEVLDFAYIAGEHTYQSGERQGQKYRRYTYGGHVGAVPEEIHEMLQAGEIQRISIVLNTSEVTEMVLNADTDQEEPRTRVVRGLNISGFSTYEQVAALQKKKVVLEEAKAELDVVRAKARKRLEALEVE